MRKVIVLLFIFWPLNVYASTLVFPEINSLHAIIYDLTSDEVIYEKQAYEETSVASLTKILTTITAIEKISDLNESVVITSNMLDGIYWNASRAGLKVGDIVTYQDLLYATILPSGADAAQVLAMALSGDITSFVRDMNNLAKNIGMNNSNFVNITGLDADNHYSTAQDIALLLDYALENPIFKNVYTTKTYTLTNGLVVNSTLNLYEEKFNLDTSRILGSKTGTTDRAGLCLSSLIDFENHEMVVITLNAPLNTGDNVIDSLNLINFLDNNYTIPKPIIDNYQEEVSNETILPVINDTNITKFNYQIYIPFIIFGLFLVLCFLLLINKSKKRHKRR